MSDNSQTLVDTEISLRSARSKIASLRKLLISQGIIRAELDTSTLGGDLGHGPGAMAKLALAPCKPAIIKNHFKIKASGVQFLAERRVHDTAGNGVELVCEKCQRTLVDPPKYIDAVVAWGDGNDAAVFACPKCKFKQGVSRWSGPFAFGLGCLSVEFCNWPPLSDAFVESVAAHLGHRVVVVRAHI